SVSDCCAGAVCGSVMCQPSLIGELPLGSRNSILVWALTPISPGRSIFDWGDITLPRADPCWARPAFVNPTRRTSAETNTSIFFFTVLYSLARHVCLCTTGRFDLSMHA